MRENLIRNLDTISNLSSVFYQKGNDSHIDLVQLRLDRNPLAGEISPIFELPRLQLLDLNYNKIHVMPRGIGKLTALKNLGLRGTEVFLPMYFFKELTPCVSSVHNSGI